MIALLFIVLPSIITVRNPLNIMDGADLPQGVHLAGLPGQSSDLVEYDYSQPPLGLPGAGAAHGRMFTANAGPSNGQVMVPMPRDAPGQSVADQQIMASLGIGPSAASPATTTNPHLSIKTRAQYTKADVFDPKSVYDQLPPKARNWSSGCYAFLYYHNGTIINRHMTVDEMRHFIHNRPTSRPLTMLLQRAPAKSESRFFNGKGSHCLLKDCPLNYGRVHKHGISVAHIHVGEPIIALEELDAERATLNIDPFVVSGYMHLYCAERFLDLPALISDGYLGKNPILGTQCNFTVKIDDRFFPREPNESFAGAFPAGGPEEAVAQWFIYAAENGLLSGYPSAAMVPGSRAYHMCTLNQQLHVARLNELPDGTIKTLLGRPADPLKWHVHMGDLEVVFAERIKNKGAILTSAQNKTIQDAQSAWTTFAEQKLKPQSQAEEEAERYVDNMVGDAFNSNSYSYSNKGKGKLPVRTLTPAVPIVESTSTPINDFAAVSTTIQQPTNLVPALGKRKRASNDEDISATSTQLPSKITKLTVNDGIDDMEDMDAWLKTHTELNLANDPFGLRQRHL